jgi:hypothetical protein
LEQYFKKFLVIGPGFDNKPGSDSGFNQSRVTTKMSSLVDPDSSNPDPDQAFEVNSDSGPDVG